MGQRLLESIKGEKAAPWILAGFLALLIVLLPIPIMIYSNVYQNVHHDYATSNHEAARKDEFENRCSKITAVEELRRCFEHHIETGWETQRAQEDLKAQKEMADWALGMLLASWFIGVPSLMATTAGVIYVALTLKATRDAVAAAREANEVMRKSERPYLLATDIDAEPFAKALRIAIDGDFIREKAAIQFDVYVKNHGTRAAIPLAMHLEYCIQPAPIDFGPLPTLGERTKSTVVAPGEGETIPGLCVIDRETIETAAIRCEGVFGLYGYIRYCDVNGTTWKASFSFGCTIDKEGVYFYASGPRELWNDIEEKPDKQE